MESESEYGKYDIKRGQESEPTKVFLFSFTEKIKK